MEDLLVLFTALSIFGVGVTIVDFLGILDHTGNDDGAGSDDSGSIAKQGSNLIPNNKLTQEKPALLIIAKIMGLLRNAVYFSLGFGPTGLFALFSGIARTSGLVWACAVGAAMMLLARLLKRFIRRDLDSSINSNELLQEKGVLLLPIEDDKISKAIIHQYGRNIEIYVRCKNNKGIIPKGKEISIEDYDNDVYWVNPVND